MPNKPLEVPAGPLVMGRKTITGSLIGSRSEGEQTLAVAAEKGVRALVNVLPLDRVNEGIRWSVMARPATALCSSIAMLPSPTKAQAINKRCFVWLRIAGDTITITSSPLHEAKGHCTVSSPCFNQG